MMDLSQLTAVAVPPIIASLMVVMFMFVLYFLVRKNYQLSLACGVLFLISAVITFSGPLGARVMNKLHPEHPVLYVLEDRQAMGTPGKPASSR